MFIKKNILQKLFIYIFSIFSVYTVFNCTRLDPPEEFCSLEDHQKGLCEWSSNNSNIIYEIMPTSWTQSGKPGGYTNKNGDQPTNEVNQRDLYFNFTATDLGYKKDDKVNYNLINVSFEIQETRDDENASDNCIYSDTNSGYLDDSKKCIGDYYNLPSIKGLIEKFNIYSGQYDQKTEMTVPRFLGLLTKTPVSYYSNIDYNSYSNNPFDSKKYSGSLDINGNISVNYVSSDISGIYIVTAKACGIECKTKYATVKVRNQMLVAVPTTSDYYVIGGYRGFTGFVNGNYINGRYDELFHKKNNYMTYGAKEAFELFIDTLEISHEDKYDDYSPYMVSSSRVLYFSDLNLPWGGLYWIGSKEKDNWNYSITSQRINNKGIPIKTTYQGGTFGHNRVFISPHIGHRGVSMDIGIVYTNGNNIDKERLFEIALASKFSCGDEGDHYHCDYIGY